MLATCVGDERRHMLALTLVGRRRFAMAWPGYPSSDMVTDGDKNISIIVAKPTYSQVRGQIRLDQIRSVHISIKNWK